MKARIAFYVAAVVALVLFLAVVPSHATQHRDPALQDTAQKAPASPAVKPPARSSEATSAKHSETEKSAPKKTSSADRNDKRSGGSRSAK